MTKQCSSSITPFRVIRHLVVALHIHFLRHPMVEPSRYVLVRSPFSFKPNQRLDVGPIIDDTLVAVVKALRDGRLWMLKRLILDPVLVLYPMTV